MKKYLINLYLLLLCLASCQTMSDERETVEMPTVIYVQADDQILTRTPGDPGQSAALPLPVKLYLFISSPDEQIYYRKIDLDINGWTLDTYISNTTALYKRSMSLKIPTSTGISSIGRAFAILSIQELPQFASYVDDDFCTLTLDQVKSLQFDVALSGNETVNLRDVYGGCNQIDNYLISPSTNIVCTHIAAKVDVRWNLRDVLITNSAATVKNFSLNQLPQKGYYFNDVLADGNTKVGRTLNVPANTVIYATGSASTSLSPANSIYGRQDFYVFHPNNNTIHWTVHVHDGNSTVYDLSRSSTPSSTSSEEAAYYRIDVQVDGLTSSP